MGEVRGLVAQSSPAFSLPVWEQLEEACVNYMVMGMTYDEFWYGDNDLPRYYRKVYQQKLELEDEMAWRQGKYIYDALGAVSPLFNSFSKEKKARSYMDKPYLQQHKDDQQKREQQKIVDKFKALAQAFNSHRNKKTEKGDVSSKPQ